jgi:predicted DNA-binding transcriptional regulator YafY
MLLQANGRMSARRLADEAEVSVRTIHRDVEELSASGVPIVAERGASGGFALLEGWRTRLTGLTPVEATVLSSLPEAWSADPRRVVARFHLDPVGWYRGPARTDHLTTVAHAVWNERRLKIRYESWKNLADRRIDRWAWCSRAVNGTWWRSRARGSRATRSPTSTRPRRRARASAVRRLRPHALLAESIQRFEAGSIARLPCCAPHPRA